MSKFDGSKGPPTIEGMVSLKVDNLTYRTTMHELEGHFKKFGELGDIYIPRDRNTHESRGFAFVRYYEERDAEDAMDSMDGTVIDGREIRVAMARYGRPTNQYDPGRRSRGGDRRSGGGYSRRRSPPRRRRSRSRSRSYERRRSRSRSHNNRRRSHSRSPRRRSESPPPRRSYSPKRRSRSRSRSN